MAMQPEHTPYFFLSLTGAVVLAIVFGIALPALTSRIIRDVSWARPRRTVMLLLYWWLGFAGAAWGFDAYCQWFGLMNYMSVMVFLWAVVLSIATALGFRYYRRLNLVTTRAHLEQERMLFHLTQEVSQAGFFISEPDHADPSQWRVRWANRAACKALGYDFARMDKNGMVGLFGHEIVAPDMLDTAREFASSPGKSEYLLQLLTRVGGLQWVDVAGQTMSDYHGSPLRVTYFNVVTKAIEHMEAERDRLIFAKFSKRFDQVFPPTLITA
jgi:PAS domain-containing protein